MVFVGRYLRDGVMYGGFIDTRHKGGLVPLLLFLFLLRISSPIPDLPSTLPLMSPFQHEKLQTRPARHCYHGKSDFSRNLSPH